MSYWRNSWHVWHMPAESGVYRTGPYRDRCYHAVLVERVEEGPCRRDAERAAEDLRHMQALHEDLAAGVFTAPPRPQATHRRAA